MSSAADEIIGIYRRHAEAFDRARGRGLVERPWLERFAGVVRPGGRVLDIGCGAGDPVARFLVEGGFRVTGVDASPPLIALCRERFPAEEWLVGDMRTLAIGRAYEGVLAWDSFFHLTPEDHRRMFTVFRRHAAPGAALLFNSGPAHGEAIGRFEGEALYHASLDPEEYRELLAGNGFAVVAHVVEDTGCGGRTVWLARRA